MCIYSKYTKLTESAFGQHCMGWHGDTWSSAHVFGIKAAGKLCNTIEHSELLPDLLYIELKNFFWLRCIWKPFTLAKYFALVSF